MSLEIKRLEQILGSNFGLAFLAHITGLNAWEIISGQTKASEVSTRAKTIDVQRIEGSIFSRYADFIREYPFGYTHDWIQLSTLLNEAKSDLAVVLSKITPELISLGFAAGFDQTNQYAVISDQYSKSDRAEIQPIWKSNSDAWWTHPNTQPSFQGSSVDVAKFAIDDAMVYPSAMSKMALAGSPQVYEILDIHDWLALVLRFPVEAKLEHLENWPSSVLRPEDPIWIPDWREVAEGYQGVYLSPAAYLGLSYAPLELPDGRVTFLSGWSPGATFWLPQRSD